MNAPLVDMDEHLSFDNVVNGAMIERYAMPAVVVAALRQAGKHAVMKLLTMIESDKFDKLPIDKQLQIINLALDRAYGRSETASSSLSVIQRAGGLKPQTDATMSTQLKAIEERMQSRQQRLPEMRRAQRAIDNQAVQAEYADNADRVVQIRQRMTERKSA